jgi:hypothetical protein
LLSKRILLGADKPWTISWASHPSETIGAGYEDFKVVAHVAATAVSVSSATDTVKLIWSFMTGKIT